MNTGLMDTRRWLAAVAIPLTTLFWAAPAAAQTFPQKPIRIMTSAVGGAGDIGARLIASGFAESLGQQGIVENRSGSGIVSIETVLRAKPDGYTLLIHGSITWLLPFMRETPPWDPVRDFSHITLATMAPSLLVVHPSLPVKSVPELVALAKARPGQLNYASGSTGVISHLAGELFKSMTGTNIVRVPYGGTGPGLNALISGEIHMMFPAAFSGTPHVRSGRLRALAVATLKPTELAPGLPTLSAVGLPGFESGAATAVHAPAGTPAAIVTRLNQAIVALLTKPEVKEKMFRSGSEVIANTPEEFAARLKADMARWGKVIKDADIRAN